MNFALLVPFREAKSRRVFFHVFESALNEPEYFLFYPLWRAFFFGKCHPAMMDSLANSVVNHERPHEFSH